jgi:hypothetical protein
MMAPLVASQHCTAVPVLESTPDYLATGAGKDSQCHLPAGTPMAAKIPTLERMPSVFAWMSESQGVTG